MFDGAGSGAGVSSKLFCCPRGFYLDATPSCQLCPPGRFQQDFDIVKNISDCPYTAEQACPAGTYVDSQSSSCRSCPAGKWSSERGVEQCADVCPVGTWSDQVGLSSAEQCTQCESGRYASSAQLTAMTSSLAACDKVCEAGKWSNETGLVSESQCKLCPKGRWSGETAQSLCKLCYQGKSTRREGAVSVSECSDAFCEPGTFMVEMGPPATCELDYK